MYRLIMIAFVVINFPLLAHAEKRTSYSKESSSLYNPFGSLPANSISLSKIEINMGNQVTYSDTVSVAFSFSKPRTSLYVTYYRLSENQNFSRSPWLQLGARGTGTYRLQGRSGGQRTVYGQLKSGNVVSATRNDNIEYRPLPTISAFTINCCDSSNSTETLDVALRLTYFGVATTFRVGEDIENATWRPIGEFPESQYIGDPNDWLPYDLEEGAIGMRTVYVQLRRDSSPIVEASATINFNPPPCPRGANGQICSGDGICGADGNCLCDRDYSGLACETVCQQCYGALGTLCSPYDEVPSVDGMFGDCPDGENCGINVGSWLHDECCIRHRINGPNPDQGSCGPGGTHCQEELKMAIAHALWGPTWHRNVDYNVSRCTEGIELEVDFDAMCALRGESILCQDAPEFCCSGSGTNTFLHPGMCNCD